MYKGIKIIDYFMERKDICEMNQSLNTSHRCNQIICDFADNLFAELSGTISTNEERTGHDGVFIVHLFDMEEYIQRYNLQCFLPRAINFRDSKGLTFNRVLIKPTQKMERDLKTGELELDETTLAKFYVDIKKAKYSVRRISSANNIPINSISYFE